MIINNKRGMSSLITNVSLILIVTFSVAIIGVLVMNLVNIVGDSTQIKECELANLENYNGYYDCLVNKFGIERANEIVGDGTSEQDSAEDITIIEDYSSGCTSTISEGLIAHYCFDGDALDFSGNGNDGVDNNGLTYNTKGGKTFASFDGVDDYIEVLSPSGFEDDLTISFWMKSNETLPLNYQRHIISKGNVSAPDNYRNYDFMFHLRSMGTLYNIVDYGPQTSFLFSSINGSSHPSLDPSSGGQGWVNTNTMMDTLQNKYDLHDGNWHLVTITRTLNETRFYYDSELVHKDNYLGKIYGFHNSNASIFIGSYPNGWSYPRDGNFKGDLDDLMIFDVELNQIQINKIFVEQNKEEKINWKNIKDLSKYNEGNVFLVSDNNWRDALTLVPVTTWRDNLSDCKRGYQTSDDACLYPNLIWHQEDYFEKQSFINNSISTENGLYDVDGTEVVYYKNGSIYLYDIPNDTSNYITGATQPSLLKKSGRNIAWREGIGPYWIMVYNLDDKNKTRIDPRAYAYSWNIQEFSITDDYLTWVENLGYVPHIWPNGTFHSCENWTFIGVYDLNEKTYKDIGRIYNVVDIRVNNKVISWRDSKCGILNNLNIYDFDKNLTNRTGILVSDYELGSNSLVYISNNSYINSLNLSSFNATTHFYIGQNTRIDDFSDLGIITLNENNQVRLYELNGSYFNITDGLMPYSSSKMSNSQIAVMDNDKSKIHIYDAEVNNVIKVSKFDIDSIMMFLKRYSPNKIEIYGEYPQEVKEKLESLGKEITEFDNTYDYWDSLDGAIYVDDDYELSVLASAYAALVNTPLVIEGGIMDRNDISEGKDFICIGNVSKEINCVDSMDIEELKIKYRYLVNESKYILTTNDLESHQVEMMEDLDYSDFIKKLYYKVSLISPILSVAKSEYIFFTNNSDLEGIRQDISENTINPNIDDSFLTIIASPHHLPINKEITEDISIYNLSRALDPEYADINDDNNLDFSVGRITGISSSDVSSYLSRVLFYNKSSSTNTSLFAATTFDFSINQLDALSGNFSKIYETYTYSCTGNPCSVPLDFWTLPSDLIYYEGHGFTYWSGLFSSQIPELYDTFIISHSCLTCGEYTFDKNSFCSNAIRKGAIGYVGAVSIIGMPTEMYFDVLNGVYYYNYTLGESYSRNVEFLNLNQVPDITQTVFIGDPTFHPGQNLLENKIIRV